MIFNVSCRYHNETRAKDDVGLHSKQTEKFSVALQLSNIPRAEQVNGCNSFDRQS